LSRSPLSTPGYYLGFGFRTSPAVLCVIAKVCLSPLLIFFVKGEIGNKDWRDIRRHDRYAGGGPDGVVSDNGVDYIHNCLLLAERVGFEPTVGKPDTRSPGVPVRPLQHLSAERVGFEPTLR
jgi:hypothetical protein